MHVKKRILTTISALAVINLLLLGAGAMAATAIRKDAARIAEAQAELDTQYALHRYMRTVASTLTETSGRLGELRSMAIQEGEELQFITALERAADAAGVDQSIALETANQKDLSAGEREIPLKLEFSGTYPQALRYLNAIERLPYVIVFTGVTFETSRQDGQFNPDGRVQAAVTATAYWQASTAPSFTRPAEAR